MAIFTKPLIAGIVGFLAWTLTIHVAPVKLEAQSTPLSLCHQETTSQHVFQSMIDGIVTHMYNDGSILSIEVSSRWESLAPLSQKRLYEALRCLAQHENVAFQVLPSPTPLR